MSNKTINKVIQCGRLGKDIEVRKLPNGTSVCSFSLALNEGYKDRNTGQNVDKTVWVDCEAFGRNAEHYGQYFKKGMKIYVLGKLDTSNYQKQGVDVKKTFILVDDAHIMDFGNHALNNSSGQAAPQQQAAPTYGQAPQQAPQQQAAPAYAQAPQQQAAPAYAQAPQQAPRQQAPQQQAAPAYAQAPQQAPQQSGDFQPYGGNDDTEIPF